MEIGSSRDCSGMTIHCTEHRTNVAQRAHPHTLGTEATEALPIDTTYCERFTTPIP